MRAFARAILALPLVLAVSAAAPIGERCDGCGMSLAAYRQTLHRLTLTAGERKTFCSFSCLAEAVGRTPAERVGKIEAADYTTGAFVDARAAAYVEGSDAAPVMAAVSLVAFGSPAAAAEYRGAHGGVKISFQEALERHRARNPAPTAVPAIGQQQPRPVFAAVPGQGKKVRLDAERYFVFTFDKKPTMGTVIAKVEIFAADGRKDTSLEIKGNADMPSMGCQSGKADRAFVLSKKGDYLLPYTFGMPGDWEVYLTFLKDGVVVYRGKYAFAI